MGTPQIKGHSGFAIPAVGLGTYLGSGTLDFDEAMEKMKLAIDIGYRHFDTASIYNTEDCLGKALKAKLDEGKVKREDLFIVTKVWPNMMSYDNVLKAIKTSLEKLQLSYVDLYLIHWPFAFEHGHPEPNPIGPDGKILVDDSIDYLDTWKAMEEVKRLGLAKNIGVSNFNIQQIERLWNNCDVKPVCNQFECNIYFQNDELVKFCQAKEIVCVAYCPMCKGTDGTGNKALMHMESTNRNILTDTTISKIAQEHDKTNSQVALRFLIERNVVVIPKSNNEGRLRNNFDLFGFSLSEENMKMLRALDQNARLIPFANADKAKNYPF